MAEDAGEFENKQVLVTGAGKGIRRLLRNCWRRGAKVLAMSRSADDLVSLAAEIGSHPFVDLADAEGSAVDGAKIRRSEAFLCPGRG